MPVWTFGSQLVARRMQDRDTGQAPVQCDVHHRERDQLVELLVQRAVTVELHRQHGREQPLMLGRGRVIVGQQPLERDRVGDTGGQHQSVVAGGGQPAAPSARAGMAGLDRVELGEGELSYAVVVASATGPEQREAEPGGILGPHVVHAVGGLARRDPDGERGHVSDPPARG